MRMKNGTFEIKTRQSVNANLSVLIGSEEALTVEAAEGSHVYAGVVR